MKNLMAPNIPLILILFAALAAARCHFRQA